MPDEEGYQVAGDLQVGGYAALEGDLGEKLTGPLGFTAEEWLPDDEELVDSTGYATVAAQVRYVSPDQVESWGLFRWRTA